MRIALDQRYADVAHRYLDGHELAFYDSGREASLDYPHARPFVDPDTFLAQVGDAHVLACGGGGPWPFDESLVAALPHLMFIQKIGAGTDWFDLAALDKAGILLANNAGLNAVSVADHLVALMLLSLRSMLDPINKLRSGEWAYVPPNTIVEVESVTIGVVGYGNIGSKVVRRLLGFGDVRILVHQRRPLDDRTMPRGVRWAPLDELLQQADVIVVCVPLTPHTQGLIDARALALMKPGSILINGSRGSVVDEAALYEALVSGQLSAAASDVFSEEPPPPKSPLLRLHNFIGTPHMAGRSRRNSPRQLELALENVCRLLEGKVPERLINSHILKDETLRMRAFAFPSEHDATF